MTGSLSVIVRAVLIMSAGATSFARSSLSVGIGICLRVSSWLSIGFL